MGKLQPLLKPVLKKGVRWFIEWYYERDGHRNRIRKSEFNGIELNSITDLREREKVAMKMLADVRSRLLPAVHAPDQELFSTALLSAVELKRSAKFKTNKSFSEVTRWVLEFFSAKGWQHIRCNQVTQAHVQAYFDHCIVKLKVANTTHNTRKNNLRSLFTELVTRGYFPENYVSKVPERVECDPIRRPLSEHEKQVIWNYIQQHDRPLTLAFMLLCYLAIRPGEIRDLRVGSIDLRRGVVRFPGRDSKNNKDSTVTIPAPLLPFFEGLHLEQYPPTYFLFGKAKGRHNADMLPRPERIGINSLSQKFRDVVRLLHRQGSLPDITGIQFYSLKDTLAIYLLENGVDVERAMRHFRQNNLDVFQRYVKRLGIVDEKIRELPIDIKI